MEGNKTNPTTKTNLLHKCQSTPTETQYHKVWLVWLRWLLGDFIATAQTLAANADPPDSL